MRKSKKLWIAGIAVLAVGLFLFNRGDDSSPYTAQMISVPESNFSAVAQGKIDVDGGIIAVAARSAGIFREVFVEEGDVVEAGQVLATQEDDEQRIQLRQAEARLASSMAALEGLAVRRRIAEREHERLAPLVEIDAASPQELDRAMDDLHRIDVEVVSQKATILQSEASVESAKFSLEQRTVRAPVSGRIIEAKARPGVGASTFQVSTAFTLMPNTEKIVRADLDESFVGSVHVGQKALVSPDADPQTTYEGKVSRVGEIFGAGATKNEGGMGGMSMGDHVIEVVVTVGDVPLLIGQRVMVRFLKEVDNDVD